MTSIRVEEDGKVLRGLALPFNEFAVILDKEGRLFAEIFDEESLVRLPQNVPLLVSHNRDVPPAGMVLQTMKLSSGLGVEARIVGSDHEVEGWRRRFAAGLMTGLSIAFRASKPIWERPPRSGLPPVKRVRNAEIEEISLVSWPAYRSAGLSSVNLRSMGDELRHEESERIIAQIRANHEESQRIIAEVHAMKAAREARQAARDAKIRN